LQLTIAAGRPSASFWRSHLNGSILSQALMAHPWSKYRLDLWDLPLMAIGIGAAVGAQAWLGFGERLLLPGMIALPALRRAISRNPAQLMYERPTNLSGSPLALPLVGVGIVFVIFGLAASFSQWCS
jgi:hypothetical protein